MPNVAAHVKHDWWTHIVTGHFAGYNKSFSFSEILRTAWLAPVHMPRSK